jgi:glycosyltransferase involved in cell wall biosynthesis
MKILIISNIFPPGFIGGYEMAALDVAQGLRDRGNDIYILTSDYFLDDQEELVSLNVSRSLNCNLVTHEKIPLDSIQFRYYNFHNIRTIGSAIRRIQPDVVLAFNLIGLGAFSILQYLQSIQMPTILYLMDNVFVSSDSNSNIQSKYELLFGKVLFNNSTRIISMSQNLLNEINDQLNATLDNVTFIPGWVDFTSQEAAPVYARENKKTRFVFCSRIAPHKGIDIVVEASEILVRRGLTQFSVDLYGLGEVSPLLQRIKAKNLDEYIKYQGSFSKKEFLSVFSRYDALVFPTWEREPFGFVVSEAASAGCLPIITAGIGASEWFLDGYDCLKIFRDVDSLVGAMSQVMLIADEELLSFRKNAMKSARKNFAFEHWLTVIQEECLSVVSTSERRYKNIVAATRGAESAFLFLSSIFRES